MQAAWQIQNIDAPGSIFRPMIPSKNFVECVYVPLIVVSCNAWASGTEQKSFFQKSFLQTTHILYILYGMIKQENENDHYRNKIA